MLQACHEKNPNPNGRLTLDDYASFSQSTYRISRLRIYEEIDRLVKADGDSLYADFATRGLYSGQRSFYWIDRKGVDSRADSVLGYLQRVDSMGMDRRKFGLDLIAQDLERVRTLRFDDHDNRLSMVLARLEYRLTKAYLRYAVGQRFGFVNPAHVFNRLDVHRGDTSSKSFNTLYAIKTPHATRSFVREALHKVAADSIVPFLKACEPRSGLYARFEQELLHGGLSKYGRMRLLVNMERSRWRMPDDPANHSKYVLVNIPSFHLRAVDREDTLTMRIAFGSFDTKTPLMISKVKRMDINPQWIMPKSIIRNSIMPRLGNVSYFAHRQYFIRNRHTGEIVSPAVVTRAMLETGNYLVIQRGGEGNALGRIIFRFDNNLSIYLHDTSSRDVFEKDVRDVSHGCVRVEKPFELAVFMLADKDATMVEKIRYSMNADVSPLGIDKQERSEKMQQMADTLNRSKLVGQVRVSPEVPIFILYYTLYPGKGGALEMCEDVYGYDKWVYRRLKSVLR